MDLLDNEYTFCHFSEMVGEQRLTFDYKIKPGHSSTKNAIKLLELWDYPSEIVEGVFTLSRQLEQHGMFPED